jgi:5S rRNA maturation endonuclease (ribonuclease M5)
MKRYITKHHLANSIRMKRSMHSGSFLIVEGDKDSRLYRKFVDRDRCNIVVAHSKNKVLDTVEVLERFGEARGVLGIIDADFWKAEGREPEARNILMTDHHSLETMIIDSRALDDILCEYANEERLKQLERQRKGSIREILTRSCAPIGFMRWYCLLEGVPLMFKGLAFDRFIDNRNLALDMDKFIRELKDNSRKNRPRGSELKKGIDRLSGKVRNVWLVCQGHDMVNILLIGLKEIFGLHNTSHLNFHELEGDLRIAYDMDCFRGTELYEGIRNWEMENQGFVVLEDS